MRKYIAILEDDDERVAAMRNRLVEWFPEYDWMFFDNAPDMIQWLGDHLPSAVLICLDHDLGPNRIRNREAFDPGSGQDVVNYLFTQRPFCPVIIHTANYLAAPGMELMLNESRWTCSRVIPVNGLEWIDNAWIHEIRRYLGNQP